MKFPDDIMDTCDLLLLADEYMIVDLKQKCEEDISSKLTVQNLLPILLFVEKHSAIISNLLADKGQTLFIEEFDKILKLTPNLEGEITKVPGLMTKLFQNVHTKKLKKPRKVHLMVM
jgi:speckle-type POZ protein